jgi:L-fucose isomerase-like protein
MSNQDYNPRVALLPMARTTFDMALANQMIERARESLTTAGMTLMGPSDAITDASEAEGALSGLDLESVDVMVVLQATFADSQMVRGLADSVTAPLLLWAIPEAPTGGRLRLNSYCGVNLAAHALKRAGLRYESIYAEPEDPQVVERIRELGLVGSIQRQVRGVRIGRLGTNPDGFESCVVDTDALRQTFGAEVVPLALDDFFAAVEEVDAGEISSLRDDLRPNVAALDLVEKEPADKTLASYLAMQRLSESHRLDGFAVRCWPEFFIEMGCAACGALSLLSDGMVPAGCESDVNGVLTQWILQTIAGTPAFDTDIVAFDDATDSVVFWHCGKAPLSLADPQEKPRATIHSNRQLPLLWEFPLKPGPVTLARLSAATGNYRLTIAKGEMLRAEKSFTGTSGRCRFERPAREFMETILAEGLEHHMALVYGDHLSTLRALARRLDLPVLEL